MGGQEQCPQRPKCKREKILLSEYSDQRTAKYLSKQTYCLKPWVPWAAFLRQISMSHGQARWSVCAMPHIQAPPKNRNCHSKKTKNPIYPTHAENVGANRLDISSTSISRRNIHNPFRIKHNALLLLDVKYKQCKTVGWSNADDSNDEILMVTKNRFLSKHMQDWV